MGLLSFLKRKTGQSPQASVVHESVDSVQQARTRARQRLIGAVVLVGAGVIGFPLLFETQPRPLPVNIPIEVARKDGVSTNVPAPRSNAGPAQRPVTPPSVIAETSAEAGREVSASAPAAAVEPAVASAPTASKPKPTEKEKKPAAPAKPVEDARAQALLDDKPASKEAPKEAPKKDAAASGRFVVQVGAFAEVAAAHDARQKVEKLGLKTYTQVVQTSGGSRIRVRVGPFATRDEAEKAVGKIKSAGLPSALLSL